MDSSVASFSLGRRDADEVAVQITRRLRLPGGGILCPGERARLGRQKAVALAAQGFLTLIEEVKAPESPAHDRMQHRPVAKKGRDEQ